MSKPKTIYLAGKITGDPNYAEKFCDAEGALVNMGYVVLNPALLPPEGFEYDAYMRMSYAMLKECDAVCFLPDWMESNGAMKEFEQARRKGKTILSYDYLVNEAGRST